MNDNKNFGYLGHSFQLKLINLIITDKSFFTSIIDVVIPKYFDNQYFKLIMQLVKEYYQNYQIAPTFDALDQLTRIEISSEMAKKYVFDMLKEVKDASFEDHLFIKEKAIKFCKQQELKKAIRKVESIMEKGDFESYDMCEEYIREAIQAGEVNNEDFEVFTQMEKLLEEDYRHPLPTGIDGLDNILNGGLAKGEIGVVLAPTGVGKTTMLTRFANTAFNMGYNVLQIFFEDNPKIIQRKHFTCWTGIVNDELSNHKETVLDKADEMKKTGGKLILKKLPSDEMTMLQIKNQVRKIEADGVKLDMILIDYIDCILPDRAFNDEWKGEGSVMRKFEGMCHELDLAGWTATQGNRTSISSEVVTTDMMGGSIKKAQVGHVIISVAKTLQQKELGLATIAIVKSRLGRDGVIFENCKFDNGTLEIDTESTQTFLGFEQEKTNRNRDRVTQALQRREQVLNKNN
jgi:replicative DNA helicase|tara:strand:+ start:34411 stop:35790 length:1380 start_codon:yes stop_codon:yes gene_type:complete